jgi:NAD(P)-dependent dehydrogenase (short-subunit alcohol dehydrogenase family)
MIMKLANKLVFITGAGSGIGRATALLMAQHGTRVAISDVAGDTLASTAAELGEACVFSQTLDVSDAKAFAALRDSLFDQVGVPDIIVNNAGVGMSGTFIDTSLGDWDWLMGINCGGVVNGCHYFAPAMVKRGSGHIVNMASGLGLVGGPKLTAYAASKFAVVGLSESLRVELASEGVGVSAICPGIVNTEITNTMRVTTGEANEVREKASAFYFKRNYGPERVAKAVVKAVKKNSGLVPVCPETHFSFFLKRLLPNHAASLLGKLMPI